MDDRPRLIVLTSTYPRWESDHEPGFVHELTKRLAGEFEVTVLCPHAPGALTNERMDGVDIVRYRYAPQALERLVNDGGIVTNLRRHRWMTLLLPGFFLAQLVSLLVLFKHKKPAVIHAHWIIPQAFIATLVNLLRRRDTPVLVTSHGADLYALNGPVIRRIKRWTLSRCSKATVVSNAMRPCLQGLGMPEKQIAIAPMGVDMEKFCPDPVESRDLNELLFVGRLVEKKGVRHLLDAMPHVLSRHPEIFLTVVGFGPELPELQSQSQRLGLDGRVKFTGALAQSALPGHYRRAAMLVAPFVQASSGDREGLGLVSVEALACGCPVVTTRIDAVKEVFGGKWPRYLAEPEDPLSLAAAIIRVLENPRAASTWAKDQYRPLKHKFSWDQVALRYCRYLKSMIDHRG